MRPSTVTYAAVLAVLLVPPIAHAQPKLEFAADRVTATGLTPGAAVVWFSIANERDEWLDVLIRRQKETTADTSGASSFELSRAVPTLSVWAVIDLKSGAFDLAAPPGAELREVAFPGAALPATPAGDLRFLEDRRPYLEVLLARPGQGAWGLSVGDGSDADADAVPDGRTRVAIDSLRPLVGGRNPARTVAPGDVLVVVDPHTMETYAATVAHPKAR